MKRIFSKRKPLAPVCFACLCNGTGLVLRHEDGCPEAKK